MKLDLTAMPAATMLTATMLTAIAPRPMLALALVAAHEEGAVWLHAMLQQHRVASLSAMEEEDLMDALIELL
jgi:hypothetical protein